MDDEKVIKDDIDGLCVFKAVSRSVRDSKHSALSWCRLLSSDRSPTRESIVSSRPLLSSASRFIASLCRSSRSLASFSSFFLNFSFWAAVNLTWLALIAAKQASLEHFETGDGEPFASAVDLARLFATILPFCSSASVKEDGD